MAKHVTIGFGLFLLFLTPVNKHNIAVIEYRPWEDPHLTADETLIRNAEEYIKLMEDVSQKNRVMMFIFPESTLDNAKTIQEMKRVATKLRRREIPCTEHAKQYPMYMQKLSCAARNLSSTLVFNIIEESDYNYYTSDVIINHEGRIELSIKREIRVGANFLNNYPIAFAIPAKTIFVVQQQLGFDLYMVYPFTPTSFVTGFSFSFEKAISLSDYRPYVICSNWISELPFLISLQVYQMWAQEFNLTIFFSGANNPKKGQGGTGIYDGTNGPVVMDISPKGHTTVYVYNVRPSNNTASEKLISKQEKRTIDQIAIDMDAFYTRIDPDLNRYISQVLDPLNPPSNLSLCYDKVPGNHFCCKFNITTKVNASNLAKNEYIYHLVAYKGYKTYYDVFKPGGVEICAVIACLDEDISSCGQRFKYYDNIHWPITFEEILIKAEFGVPKEEHVYYSSQFPNSLLSSLKPLHPNATRWWSRHVKNNSYLERSFKLMEPQDRLLTFGIFGRNFTLTDSSSTSSSIIHKTNLIWLLFVVIYYLVSSEIHV